MRSSFLRSRRLARPFEDSRAPADDVPTKNASTRRMRGLIAAHARARRGNDRRAMTIGARRDAADPADPREFPWITTTARATDAVANSNAPPRIRKREREMVTGPEGEGGGVKTTTPTSRTPTQSVMESWGKGRSRSGSAVEASASPSATATKSSKETKSGVVGAGGVESDARERKNNPHSTARELKKAADELKKRVKTKEDYRSKLRVLRLYTEAVVYFVEAASMTVDDEKKKQNYRDDVNFADYVRTVCEAWYNASDADFSFRCTALRALLARLSCACSSRVFKMSTRDHVDAVEGAESGDADAISALVSGIQDARAMTKCMAQASSNLSALRAMVPDDRDDAKEIWQTLTDFAPDGGTGANSLQIVTEARAALGLIATLKKID